MPLKIKLKSAVEQEVALKNVSPFKNRIDALSRLEAQARQLQGEIQLIAGEQIKKLEPLLIKLEAEKTQLLNDICTYHDDDNPDEEFVEEGRIHQVRVTKKPNERNITDMEGLAKRLNQHQKGLFMQLAKLTLKDVDKYTTESEREPYLTRSRGKRSAKMEVRPGAPR